MALKRIRKPIYSGDNEIAYSQSLQVQTNDLASIPFSRSALPIRYVHSSKLDGVDQEPALNRCFADWANYCANE